MRNKEAADDGRTLRAHRRAQTTSRHLPRGGKEGGTGARVLAALALFTFAAEWAKLWGIPFLVAGIAIPVMRAVRRARIRRALRALSRELTELARSAYAMSASMTNATQDVPTMSEAENRDGAADQEEVSAWHYKNGRAGRRIV